MARTLRVYHQDLTGGLNLGRDDRDLTPQQAKVLNNLRARFGALVPRPGTSQLGDVASARRVITLATFRSANTEYLLRFDREKVFNYDGATNTFSDISGTETFVGTDDDDWVASDWQGTLYFCNGKEASGTQTANVYKWTGSGNVAAHLDTSSNQLPAAKALVAGYLDRLWFGNYSLSGTAYPQHIKFTARNTDNDVTSTGSGTVVLGLDPYPIQVMQVINRQLVVYKGTASGGSIYIGAETGYAAVPVRFMPVVGEAGVGILAPRTLVSVAGQFAIFLGHDDVYMFDGTTMRPIGGPVGYEIVRQINPEALRQAHAIYWPETGEYELMVPVDRSDTTPDVRYVFNLKERKWVGGESVGFTAAARFIKSIIERWNTITGTWSDYTSGPTWSDMLVSKGTPGKVYGRNDGKVVQEDTGLVTDDGTAYTMEYRSGLLTFRELATAVEDGQRSTTVQFTERTYKRLFEVELVWKDNEAWTPTVEVSTDRGASWTTITSGNSYGSGTGRLTRTTFGANLSGTDFIIKVTHQSRNELVDIGYTLTYAGEAYTA